MGFRTLLHFVQSANTHSSWAVTDYVYGEERSADDCVRTRRLTATRAPVEFRNSAFGIGAKLTKQPFNINKEKSVAAELEETMPFTFRISNI